MISACVPVSTLPPSDLDEAAQPVGTSEQTGDVDRCLLGRIVCRCLKTHRGTSIPGGRSVIRRRVGLVTSCDTSTTKCHRRQGSPASGERRCRRGAHEGWGCGC